MAHNLTDEQCLPKYTGTSAFVEVSYFMADVEAIFFG